ncbi:MAG TPA: hypothetical protein VFM09_08125 [Marmoricola sp.]|nr:hypothetical protein [Marmoricola sp.]
MSMLPLSIATPPLVESTSFYVGGGALVIFLVLLLAMLSFGKGREHS